MYNAPNHEIILGEIKDHAQKFAVASKKHRMLNRIGEDVYSLIAAGVVDNQSWMEEEDGEDVAFGHLSQHESLTILTAIANTFPFIAQPLLRLDVREKKLKVSSGESHGTIKATLSPEPKIIFRIKELRSSSDRLDIIYNPTEIELRYSKELLTLPMSTQYILLTSLPNILSSKRGIAELKSLSEEN